MLAISGWRDGAYMNGAISRFLSIGTEKRSLLLGPWDHGGPWNAKGIEGLIRFLHDVWDLGQPASDHGGGADHVPPGLGDGVPHIRCREINQSRRR